MPLETTEHIWHNGQLIRWEERQDPRHEPRHPLRLLRLRGHPLLRPGQPPEYQATPAPASSACTSTWQRLVDSAKDLPHAPALHRRPALRRRRRGHRGQRRRPLLHPPHRLPRLRRNRRQPPQARRSRSTSPTSRGASTSPATTAPTSASPPGTRLAPNTMPSLAKAGANYMNSQLIRMEADINGYAEGIALDTNGYLSEGSGENLFLVRGNVLYTTPLANSVTQRHHARNSILTLARELGIPVVEQPLPRELLYICRRSLLHRHRRRGHPPPLHRPHPGRRRHHGPQSPKRHPR